MMDIWNDKLRYKFSRFKTCLTYNLVCLNTIFSILLGNEYKTTLNFDNSDYRFHHHFSFSMQAITKGISVFSESLGKYASAKLSNSPPRSPGESPGEKTNSSSPPHRQGTPGVVTVVDATLLEGEVCLTMLICHLRWGVFHKDPQSNLTVSWT